jgi:hypothetical protein
VLFEKSSHIALKPYRLLSVREMSTALKVIELRVAKVLGEWLELLNVDRPVILSADDQYRHG